MADNFAFTPGSGATGAADNIDGVLYPRVKLDWGADGVANDVDIAAGKALPVQLRDTSGDELATASHPLRTDPTGTTTQPVSAASLPLPSGAATETTLATLTTQTDFDTKIGSLTETAPSTDTASSGLNGRLQRIAQRLTSLIALIPSALTGSGNFKIAVVEDTTSNKSVNLAQVAGASAATGHGSASGALRVELPTDSTGVVNAAQSGTWTVQPGNTANTTPWLTQSAPATSGGLTYSWNSIKATATSIKSSAGQVYGWYIYNSNSSVVYVQFFNTASGSVTLGTTTPVYSLGIPATAGANVFIPHGIVHGTAITIAATTTATGSTSPGNNVDINVFYK